MRFDARVAYGLMSVALVGFSGVMADEIDDILGDSAASPASVAEPSSTTVAILKPSFTVRSLSNIGICSMANHYHSAYCYQSTLLRTVHRRLGIQVEGISCEEGKRQDW